MLDLAKHIVEQKSGHFEPEKFEDHYETALTELINKKRNGQPIAAKPRPKGDNVVDLMDALRRSLRRRQGRAAKPAAADTASPPPNRAKAKKRKVAAGQKEMLLPISGSKASKTEAGKAEAGKKPVRTTAKARKAG